jgi:hypothetical protein
MIKRNGIYRKVWSDANGPIPRDANGRVYDIHHINGDHSDNRLENLIALSIDEHYNVHFQQGDFGACALIAKRLNQTPEQQERLFAAMSGKGNPTYNHTVYSFKRCYDGLEVSETMHEMSVLYGINRGNLVSLIKGERPTAGGWTMNPPLIDIKPRGFTKIVRYVDTVTGKIAPKGIFTRFYPERLPFITEYSITTN